jgi:hypothetical protein
MLVDLSGLVWERPQLIGADLQLKLRAVSRRSASSSGKTLLHLIFRHRAQVGPGRMCLQFFSMCFDLPSDLNPTILERENK